MKTKQNYLSTNIPARTVEKITKLSICGASSLYDPNVFGNPKSNLNVAKANYPQQRYKILKKAAKAARH